MLEAIRKRSASFLVKLLFGLLVLSFGLWGIADVFNPGRGGDWAAEVGDSRIPAATVRSEYQRELRRLNSAFGTIDSEQAKALGLPNRVLNQIVDRTLLDLGAEDLGIVVGDTLVRQAIQADPTFHNQLGTFDANLFRQILSINGLTENDYVTMIRDEIARNQLVGSVVAGATVSPSIVDAIYRYRGEKRVAEILRVDDAAMGDIAEPDEAELQKFYKDNETLFTAPEYRAVTAVILLTRDLAKDIAVSDEELEAAFNQRINELGQPERRTLRQMVFSDEKAAIKAYDRIAGGADFATVAKEEAGLEPDALDVGTVTRDQLPAELADAAFALAKNVVSKPVKSPLGWHLIEVTAIEPAHRPSLADVRDKLAAEVANEKALDTMFDLTNRLEDALGSGATLEEAAAELDLDVRKIAAIDPQGLNPEGRPVADLPPGFLDVVFATDENSESPLTEAGNEGYFILRVDAVTPPTLKPLDSVRSDVVKAWKAQRRSELAKKTADSLASRIKGGIDPASLATEKGPVFVTSTPFTRSGEGFPDTLPKALIAAVFRTPPGDTVVVRGEKASYVARTKAVVAADPTADQARLTELRDELARARGVDLLSQLTGALRQQYPVTVNNRQLENLF
jgi:peptidyl-prolyl cis-trans isomerase D